MEKTQIIFTEKKYILDFCTIFNSPCRHVWSMSSKLRNSSLVISLESLTGKTKVHFKYIIHPSYQKIILPNELHVHTALLPSSHDLGFSSFVFNFSNGQCSISSIFEVIQRLIFEIRSTQSGVLTRHLHKNTEKKDKSKKNKLK